MQRIPLSIMIAIALIACASLIGQPQQQQQPYPQQPYPQQPYPPQAYPQQAPPPYVMPQPQDLERLLDRIALYPDPLLSNILAAATYSEQILDAEAWAHRHEYLRGDQLARAIADDRLPFDPSVQALLPFPAVLDMMARDIDWTRALGSAFLNNNAGVMDAVQRLRRRSYDYGYLRSNPQVMVSNGPYIEIMPVNPAYLYVPFYDPAIVFFAPRGGFRIGIGINFGPAIILGPAFRPWGWFEGGNRFFWGEHRVFINGRNWERGPGNFGVYNHPYEVPRGQMNDRREGHERREGPARGGRDERRR